MLANWKVEYDLHGDGYYVVDDNNKTLCYIPDAKYKYLASLIAKIPQLICSLESQIKATSYMTVYTKNCIDNIRADIENLTKAMESQTNNKNNGEHKAKI